MLGILTDGRELAVRFAHKLLELVLKRLILGGCGRIAAEVFGLGTAVGLLTALRLLRTAFLALLRTLALLGTAVCAAFGLAVKGAACGAL